MKTILALSSCSLVAIVSATSEYTFPSTDKFLYGENFQGEFNWIKSSDPDYVGQPTEVSVDKELKEPTDEDSGLVLLQGAKKYGLVGRFNQPLKHNSEKPFVLQYEVKFTQGMTCGGAYLKLLQSDVALDTFNGQSPYSIMFGPDHCGTTNKIHFIVQYKNPISGVFEEKHGFADSAHPIIDTSSHVYSLVIRPDNTWEILVDLDSKAKGSLLEDMNPPINPSKEIDDPNDFKPEDWVDTKRIKDESAVKPEDWDEDAPEKIPDVEAVMPSDWLLEEEPMIPDPSASMPDDWDEEEDGEWEAPTIPNTKCKKVSGCGEWQRPLIANPNFKGKWYQPLIDNPDYIGEWKAKQIENPYYFEDLNPYASLTPMAGVAVEVWTMTGGIRFDNIIITESEEQAAQYATETWKLKQQAEKMFRKTLSKEERREDLERKRQEGGFTNFLEVYLNDFVEFTAENMIPVLGSIFIGLIGLVFLFSRSGNSEQGEIHSAQLKKETKPEVNEQDLESTESEEEEEEEDTASSTAKKVAKQEAEEEVAAEEEKEKNNASKKKKKTKKAE